jgi:putative colanic acid biosynthesis acetyltransferase WcaF
MSQGITDLSQFSNSWYKPGHPFKRFLWIVVSAVFFRHSLCLGSLQKRIVLRLFGARIGKKVVIKPSVQIKYPWKLEIGDYSWIGEHCWIDNLGQVKIGAHCCLSQRSMLLCGNHNYTKTTFDLMVGDITLEDGAWLGAGSMVGPGVTMGSHSVLTAFSMASADLSPYAVYRGNPAIKVGERRILAP